MINIDLSKAPSLRFALYLLSIIPGLLFLVSIALGNPRMASAVIDDVEKLYPGSPTYVALFLLLGSAFVIGQAFVLSAWLLETCITSLIRLPRAVFGKVFGAQWLYMWFGKYQGVPPKRTVAVRALGRMIFLARTMGSEPADARVVRTCLGAAVEKLLQRRYGIDSDRAGGPNGEWGVWYSILGKLPKRYAESLNAGRLTLAAGISGFCAMSLAPNLIQRYFFAMCSLFVFSGLWTGLANFMVLRDPVRLEALRLRAVLAELQELPPETAPQKESNAK
ncbi:MAG: hypothetical protein KGJ51_10385 [Acidobacteriota bacterium]|nr:hypothetical protein [Acidobacteriota bacterium]MDE3162583.1 hypothetical protein [Acidobacteriota bacterium]